MKDNPLQTIRSVRCLLLVFSLLGLPGCTHTINPPSAIYRGYTPLEKIPLKVAINVTDELRNGKGERHSMGDTFFIPIGRSIAENAPMLTRNVFLDVVETQNKSTTPNPVDAILTPKLVDIDWSVLGGVLGETSLSKSIMSTKVEWSLRDPTGVMIWVDTIAGESSGSRGGSDPEQLLKNALEQMLRKTHQTMCSATEIQQFAMRTHPDVKFIISSLPAGNSEILEQRGALKSSNIGEVVRALKTLRRMNAPEAVPDILPILKVQEPGVVRDACRTLAVLGNKDAIPYIEPLLKHKRKDVRKDAQDAIDKLKQKS